MSRLITKKPGKVSVFLPVLIRDHADKVMTEACIELMRAYTDQPYELVIVETGARHLEDRADKYYHFDAPPGIGRTINTGFRLCSHPLRAMMSNDVFIQKGWLEALVAPFIDDASAEDCGASTIAACELGHKRRPAITEGIYFPCSMWHEDFSSYDEEYAGTWSDADMCTRMYLAGKKMYRNYASMAHHLWNKTIVQDDGYHRDYEANLARYKEKFKEHKGSWIYRVFTEGIIV